MYNSATCISCKKGITWRTFLYMNKMHHGKGSGCSQELASKPPGDCDGPSPSEALLRVGSWAVKGCPL